MEHVQRYSLSTLQHLSVQHDCEPVTLAQAGDAEKCGGLGLSVPMLSGTTLSQICHPCRSISSVKMHMAVANIVLPNGAGLHEGEH